MSNGAKRQRTEMSIESTPLISAAMLKEDVPASEEALAVNDQAVADIRAVLEGKDDRLIVITGPCSVHNVQSAMEFAGKLKAKFLPAAKAS